VKIIFSIGTVVFSLGLDSVVRVGIMEQYRFAAFEQNLVDHVTNLARPVKEGRLAGVCRARHPLRDSHSDGGISDAISRCCVETAMEAATRGRARATALLCVSRWYKGSWD
jgi:hypothetical protein